MKQWLLSLLMLCSLLACSKKEEIVDTPEGKARYERTEELYIASRQGLGTYYGFLSRTPEQRLMNYVRKSPQEEWKLKSLNIYGFTWEEGYEYHISYKVYTLLNPPEDEFEDVKILDKVISKRKQTTVIP